ncbi:MAG: ATPase [Spirochaetes bacterium]|nr:ATPase [Spirochaetota bacterium]
MKAIHPVYRFAVIAACALAAFVAMSQGLFAETAAPVTAGPAGGLDRMSMVLSAMGAVGISCLSSSYALAKIGSAAMGAMSEKPEIGGRAIVFLGMAEGIAIYGLIVAIMILNKI